MTVILQNRQWSHTIQLTQAQFGILVDGHRILDIDPKSRACWRKGDLILELQAQDIRNAGPDDIACVIQDVSSMLHRRGRYETVPGEQAIGAVLASYPNKTQPRDEWSQWRDNLPDTSIDTTSGRSNIYRASGDGTGQTGGAATPSCRSNI